MLKFKLGNYPISERTVDNKEIEIWKIIQVLPEPSKIICGFIGSDESFDYPSLEVAPLLAGDYVDFMNDKYFDKEINKEWPVINIEERLKYHQEQVKLLKERKSLRWNEHGTGVE